MKKIFFIFLAVLTANAKEMLYPRPDNQNPDYLLSKDTLAAFTIKQIKGEDPEFLVEKFGSTLKVIQTSYSEKKENLFEKIQLEFFITTHPQKTIEKISKQIILFEYKNSAWEISAKKKEKIEIPFLDVRLMEKIFHNAKEFESSEK